MMKSMATFVLGVLVPCQVLPPVFTGYARGSIQLNMDTFRKIIPRFSVALVKVDKDYPHGVNQTQFEKLVAMLSQDKETIAAEIGVQEFGEKENADLAAMLGVSTKAQWPTLFIFKRNPNRWIAKYNGRFSLNRLRQFVDQHSEVDWSCAGCVLELDRLVQSHLFERHISAEEMIQQAKEILTHIPTGEASKRSTMEYYIKIMEKINDIGQPAVAIESARLVRLLQQKLSPEKRRLLKARVDILYFAFSGNLWRYQEEEIAVLSDPANTSTEDDEYLDSEELHYPEERLIRDEL